jgi:serine/threonine-protein kinase
MRDVAGLLGGRYEVRGVLGYGGMAEVRDGWDTRLARPVAIKLLSPVYSAQPDMLDRFRAEARTAASLNHPNVVAVYDSGDHAGMPYIVMERLPGATLAGEIARGPLSVVRLRAVLDNVLNAVAAAHSAGILHRDIKPGNILLSTPDGAMKVADFGISKTVDTAPTRTGEVLGTMAYLSPQRVSGAPASPADDLYAIGVVAYEALTGWPPFHGDNPGALARSILDDEPPPVTSVRPDVDPVMAGVVSRAMARNPQQRFVHAPEMLAALRGVRPPTKVLHAPILGAPASAVYVPPPRRRWSRRTKALVGSGAGVAVLTGGIAFAALHSTAPQAVSPEPVSTSVPAVPVASTTPSTSQAPAVPPQESINPPARPGTGGHGNGKKHKGD